MYIHQKPDWPDFKWNDTRLATILATVRHEQGLLLGRMQSLGFDLQNEASLETITKDVVTTSAIEGELLDTDQVLSSIAKRLGVDIGSTTASNRNVDAIVEVMLDATQRYQKPLTDERLFGWQAALFPTGRSGMHKITVGAWRTDESGAMQVISGAYGKEKVHFEAPHADILTAEMKQFLTWFESPNTIDPVLKAAIAHLWFVTIHPFEDGNGRIGRAITDMALARSDNSAQRFYSMSTRIEQQRNTYYDQLEAAQKGGLDITNWLEWFLTCLSKAIASADDDISHVLKKASLWQHINQHPINERQRIVINRLLNNFEGKLTSSKYAKLAKCSQDTALRDIQALMAWNVLEQSADGGRSTSYEIKIRRQISMDIKWWS